MLYSMIYLLGCLISLVLIRQLINVRKSELGTYLIVMTSLVTFWLLTEGLSYYIHDEGVIIFLQKIKYISVVSITPMMFVTSIVITFGKSNLVWRRSYLLFIVPCLSLLSLLTNQIPYAFIQNPRITYENELLLYNYDRDIGFYVHFIYSYIVLFLSNIVLVYRVIKSPKLYKNQSYFIAIGEIVAFLFNILFITKILSSAELDTTPVFILLSLFVYYWGIYIMPANKLLMEARSLLVENVSDLMIILDNQGNVVDVNNAALSFFSDLYYNKEDKELKQSDYLNVALGTLVNQLHIDNHKKEILQGHKSDKIEFVLNDALYYYHFHRQSILDEKDQSIGDLVLLQDITATQIYMKELIDKNKELTISEAILENARESVIILDKDGKIIKVNQSMLTMSGFTSDEVMGHPFSRLRSPQHDILFYENIWDSVSSDGYWEGEISEQRKNGDIYLKWMSYTTIFDQEGKVTYYVIISSDISKLKKAEDDLVHMAYYDSLTDLPNRVLFGKRLKKAIETARKNKREMALLYIDLDKFKDINDNLGHWAGDQLLTVIAGKISGVMKKGDTVSRLGGDEFTVILEDVEGNTEVETIAQKMIKALEEPIYIQDVEINVVISIGIAMGPTDDLSDEDLIRKADIAMYQAKKSKLNDYCFISEEIEKIEKLKNQMGMDLKRAYKANEFTLYLQPQIKRTDKKIEVVGAEALIRWMTSHGEMVSPGDFIPIAEENGMIHKIGLWVFEEIFRLNTKLRQEGYALDLSINVSVLQFEGKEFMESIATMVEAYTQPINLTIEITESLFFDDLEIGIEHLQKLKDLGFKIAMDDFGTGFSSMSYLKRLPLDYVKIDQSFVNEIELGSKKNLADMAMSMANMLDLKTVGEGVETEVQAAYLTAAGCDLLQGFLYAKPLAIDAFMDYLKKMRTEATEMSDMS